MTIIDQTTLSASKFWNFSLKYYKLENNEQVLVRLQDKYGLDVNIVLLALWAGGSYGFTLEKTHFEILDDAINEWRSNIIQPLRRIRQFSKRLGNLDPTVRTSLVEEMAELEIHAERVCQTILIDQFSSLQSIEKIKDTHIATTNNLDSYLAHSNVRNTKEIYNARNRLLLLMEKFRTIA